MNDLAVEFQELSWMWVGQDNYIYIKNYWIASVIPYKVEENMYIDRSVRTGYIVTALLGAVAGGLVVAWVTHAIPRMMKHMMAGMMENMRAQMGAEGCKPDDI